MDSSLLVAIFGWPATLIHGDTLVLDRWLWLAARIPKTSAWQSILDAGCGTGSFSIGMARRGHRVLGLSWDERNQSAAVKRAALCRVSGARFQIMDLRVLSSRQELLGHFDTVICTEVIEHILDDQKLLTDLSRCLKPGGRLLLTTPNHDYKPITPSDNGPFATVEDGGHVRRGYTRERLVALCSNAELAPDSISFCSGLVSQKVTWLLRTLSMRLHPLIGWAAILPLRVLPPILDPLLSKITNWPSFSICLDARRTSGER